jgi:acyl-CoA synthetase (AMP-forming)/AMP-acid ligase II
MAEATLFITGGVKTEPPIVLYAEEKALQARQVVLFERSQPGFRAILGCGRAWLDTTIAIIHPETLTHCVADEVGEIWVKSPSVGKGYWNLPEESDRTFQAYLQDAIPLQVNSTDSPATPDQDTGEGPFLRTGDLGFLHNGELFITGRLKDMMVFWGLNHYPHHIEQTVEACHPALRPNGGAAFVIEVDGEEKLAIAHEVERTYRRCLVVEEVVEAMRWAVFNQHFVDIAAIALLKPGSLPKTSSGKIQRSACKTLFLEGQLETLAEWRSPSTEAGDLVSVLNRYLNLNTHIRRLALTLWGRWRRILNR